jgi:hypothetical protein
MLFQTLDDKAECFGIYTGGQVHYENLPTDLTRTWDYSTHLDSAPIEYAQMYCGGRPLSEVCPAHLKPEWDAVAQRMRAYLNSFTEAKISLAEHCFYNLVPERFLVDLCEVKNSICDFVFENYQKPENYDFMMDVVRLTTDINHHRLCIDKHPMRSRLGTHQGRHLWRTLDTMSRHIKYNVYGTKTGRLSTVKGSFPILTLNKDFRSILVPNNDYLVELDFNAAELRTLLGLTGNLQPDEDIHMWNVKNVYRDMVTRDEAKQRIFAWLYNPESTDYLSSRAYKRDEVLHAHWNGNRIHTPFGRTIEADRKHALNYLIQSTSSDVFLDRAVAVHKFLKNKKSHISMLIHDSIVLDLAECDMPELKKIVNIFSNTRYGKYKVGVSAGKTFGDLRRIR